MRTDRIPCFTLLCVAALATGACGLDGAETSVCHVQPDEPDDPQTLVVSGAALLTHLLHGDEVGACPTSCDPKCESLASTMFDVCGQAPVPLPDEDFCDAAAAAVETSCKTECASPTPSSCADFCLAVSDSTREECLQLEVDPVLCDIGTGLTYDECTLEFECPSPPSSDEQCVTDCVSLCMGDPMCADACDAMCTASGDPMPSCEDACSVEAQTIRDACFADPPDLAGPCAALDPYQRCFIDGQAYMLECLYGPMGCYQPEFDCHASCGADAHAAALECMSEPLCQDPMSCEAEAFASSTDCAAACVPGGCDPITETSCPDGTCVPLGDACPLSCEEQCPPGDMLCGADCCMQNCPPEDPACGDACCFHGCFVAFPDDPDPCIEQHCVAP